MLRHRRVLRIVPRCGILVFELRFGYLTMFPLRFGEMVKERFLVVNFLIDVSQ